MRSTVCRSKAPSAGRSVAHAGVLRTPDLVTTAKSLGSTDITRRENVTGIPSRPGPVRQRTREPRGKASSRPKKALSNWGGSRSSAVAGGVIGVELPHALIRRTNAGHSAARRLDATSLRGLEVESMKPVRRDQFPQRL